MKKGNRGYYYYQEQSELEDEQAKKARKVPFSEKEIAQVCEMYGYPYEDLFSGAITLNSNLYSEPFRKTFKTLPFTFFSLNEFEQRTILSYWGINTYAPCYQFSYLNMDYQNGFTENMDHHSLVLYAQFYSVDGEKFVSGGMTDNFIFTKSIMGDSEIVLRFYKKSSVYRYSVVNPRPTTAILNNQHDFSIRIKKESDTQLGFSHETRDDTGEFQTKSIQSEGIFHSEFFEKVNEIDQLIYMIDLKSKDIIILDKEQFQVQKADIDVEVDNLFKYGKGFVIVTSKHEIWDLSFEEKGWKPIWVDREFKMTIPDFETTCSVMNSRQYVLIQGKKGLAFRYFANGKFYELDIKSKKLEELADIEEELKDCMYFAWNATDLMIYYVINNNLHIIDHKNKKCSLEIAQESFDPSVMDILPCKNNIFFYSYDDSIKTFYLTTIEYRPNDEGFYVSQAPEVVHIDSYKFKEQVIVNTIENGIFAANDTFFGVFKDGNLLTCSQHLVSPNMECSLRLPSNDVDLTMGYEDVSKSRDQKEAENIQAQIKSVDDEMGKLKMRLECR